MDYLLAHPTVILFMDEVHSLLSVSSSENRVSPFANFLKPNLGTGKIRMIGATTNREYESMNARDSALARRFVRIDVPEPSRDETIGILAEVARTRARQAGLSIGDGVLEAALDLSVRYIHDRCLPDKAIDILTGCIGRKSAEQASTQPQEAAAVPVMIDLVDRELKAVDRQDWDTTLQLVAEWFGKKGKLWGHNHCCRCAKTHHRSFRWHRRRRRRSRPKNLGA